MNNAKILTYHNGSELSQIINDMKARFAGREETTRFVIPSRKDKIWKLELDDIKYIWTWEELYEDICKSGSVNRKRILSPPDHMLILKAILNDVLNEHADKASQWPGLSRAGFPDVLSSDIRELLNEAVKPEQMINDSNSNEPSEFMLPEVYKRYLDYLDNNNLLDSARIWTESLEEILKNLEWGKSLSIIFVGFLSFTHGQLELLYALQDRCRELIIIQPEANLANFRDTRAQLNVKSDSDSESKKSSGVIIELPVYEPGLEPEVIARTLALWSQGKWQEYKEFPGFDSIGMMIAQGREDLFAQAFKRYGVPYNLQSGIRINLTLPGKILASIRHLNARQFPTYETALLLTQECFAGLNFPVMSAYRAGYSGLDGWTEYLTKLTDSDSQTFICDSLKLKKTPAGIMRAFHEFITAPGLWLDRMNKASELPELDETTRITASAIQTIGEKVLRLEELMPDLGPVQDTRINNDEAFDYLESWCRETNTRAPLQISNSVRIFTGQPPVLCSLPVWIMTGVTQKTWSANITSSPLLGNEERAKLSDNDAHLPTTSEKAIQREALFRRLIHTGEKLTIISRPELDEEDRPISESPFMQRFLDDLPDWKRVKAKPSGISILLGRDNFIFPEVDSPREKTPRAKPVLKSKLSGVGASDIKTLLSCPFLWFQRSQARLYEPDSEIILPVEWGNMIHKLWECVWKRYRVDMKASGKFFLSIVNDEWEKLLNSGESGDYEKYAKLVKDFRLARHLEGVKFRVDRLALTQAAILDKLHEAGYEHSKILLEEDAHLKANIDNITFLGQCDRIEILRSPAGQEIAFIADYKEGRAIKSESGLKKIESLSWNLEGRKDFKFGLQLSCYASLFKTCHKNISLAGVYILGLEDGRLAGTFTLDEISYFTDYLDDTLKKKKTPSTIDDRIDEGGYAMKCAAVILNSGEFEPEYDSDSCSWCRVKSLCRKGEFKGESLAGDNDDNNDDDDDN